MPRAVFNNQVIAESDDYELVEGNVYFPPEAIKSEYFRNSEHRTVCAWKGEAEYFDVVVDGETAPNAAWQYPQTSRAAKKIEGYIAFYPTVEVSG